MKNEIRNRIYDALRSSRADYTDIRIEEHTGCDVSYKGKTLQSAQTTVDTGGIVRALIKGHGWGVVTFNSIEDLAGKVNQAYECSRLVSVDTPILLCDTNPVECEYEMGGEFNPLETAISEKKELIQSYNENILSADPLIVDSSASYGDSQSLRWYANSEGSYIFEKRNDWGIGCWATAKKGDDFQGAGESVWSRGGFSSMKGHSDFFTSGALRAVELLGAQRVDAGEYTVILDPHLAGVFIHEAFGHLSEADHIHEDERARNVMTLGRVFGSPILNVYDDGTIPGLRGTRRFDNEGVPTGRTDLIKEGILAGRLHSRETAAAMNESATGNSRAGGYSHAPIVRMTNTAIAPGKSTFAEMLSSIKNGLYVCGSHGGQTEFEQYSFSAEYARVIRDGKLGDMVRDVTLAGNLFDTLKNIEAVGDDLVWRKGFSTCGKKGQRVPVGIGAPHIMIRNVIIGGK